MADEFCKVFNTMLRRRGLEPHGKTGSAKITVTTVCPRPKSYLFHSSNHKCLKHFYLNEIRVRYRHLFPLVVSYNRFTGLEKSVVCSLSFPLRNAFGQMYRHQFC